MAGVSISASLPPREIRAFEAALDELARSHQGFRWDRAAESVLRRSLKPALADARARTRSRTGRLRRTLRARTPPSRGGRLPPAAQLGYAFAGRPRSPRAARTGQTLGNEYGNRRIGPGLRVVEKLLGRHGPRAEADFRAHWREWLADYARRSARRRARARR